MRHLFLKFLRRRRLERDLETELAFHREMAAAAGNPVPFGNDVAIREQARDLWRFNFLENLWRDVVYGARSLRHSPGLVASAILSLALGIGANVAIFSLAVTFLLSQPSVREPGSVVSMRIGGGSHAPYKALEMIRASGVFAEVAGENEESFINWNNGAETHRAFAAVTTRNYFSALGVPMALGRGYTEQDPAESVVLDHRFWRTHFNADPALIGRAINLDGRAYTVVGILPEAHRSLMGFGYSPELYLPRFLEDTHLAIYARLKPGMSIGEASAALRTVAARIDAVMPQPYKFVSNCSVSPIAGISRLRSERDLVTAGLFFAALLAVVGMVLLIACINVAGLLLARASTRRREIAIRLSLGASRSRLIQQLLIESMLLALAGAVSGFALAQLICSAMARVQLPLPAPIRFHFTPDWRVVSYAAVLAILATVVCGLAPALDSVRSSIGARLHREGRMRLRRALVAAQIAVSLIVLSVGSLFLRNLLHASAISPGFDLAHTVRAEVNLPPVAYKDPDRIRMYAKQAVARLKAVPGVEFAAAARIIPFNDSTSYMIDFKFDGNEGKQRVNFHWNAVTPEYFSAMEIPILRGRTFEDSDSGSVIVNRSFVDHYLAGKEPVGRTFRWGERSAPLRIVGVVAGTKNLTIGEDDGPQLYEPLFEIKNDRTRIHFVMRSATPPISQLAAVGKVLRELEPAAGTEVATLYASIGLAFLPSQVGGVLMGSVGVLGLLLTTVGLYGTMMFSVARRTREIGVRMAVGAGRAEISKLVLVDSARLLGIGGSIGLVIAWFIMKPLAAFLAPGLTPGDPITFVTVLAALACTGLIASWGPARRAMSIDPIASLRCD